MSISRREWVFAVLLTLVVLFITGVPYLAGWLTSTPDRIFEGFVIDVDDAHSHLAKMQQGYRGEWRYHILFTPEPHDGAHINSFYIVLGHLARLFGLHLVVTYHGARLIFGFVYLLTAYAFIAFFLLEVPRRRLAFVLVCFSSGLGWLALLLSGSFITGDITPVDFWFIEMYSFFIVMVFPHTSLALALMLVAFVLALYYFETGRWEAIAGATVSAVIISLIHPYTLLVVDVVLAGYWLLITFRRRRFWLSPLPGLALLVLAPLPVIFYQYLVIAQNPILAAWQTQSSTFSPPPWHYVLGYGVVLVLAIPGGWWALRREKRWPLLALWPLLIMPLLYMPIVFNLQRRMIEGVHVPLCILATVGLTHYVLPVLRRSRLATALSARGYPLQRLELLFRNLLVGLTLPSMLFLITSAAIAAAAGQPDMVHSAAEIAAVDWLGSNSTHNDIVMASYQIGGFIPASIGHRVFIGHWAETLDLENKKAEAARFYGTADDGERQDLLRRYDIAYVFYGPRERSMGNLDPDQKDYLTPVFSRNDVSIYKVTLE